MVKGSIRSHYILFRVVEYCGVRIGWTKAIDQRRVLSDICYSPYSRVTTTLINFSISMIGSQSGK